MTPTRFAPLVLLALAAPAPAVDPTYAADGVPFLTAHCVKCHGAARPKADLSLHSYPDESSVLKDRKKWERVLEVVRSGEMPPPDKSQPTLAQKERFVTAVSGVFDRADRSAKPDPGRVTMRRLNRTEYANTVRDLCGVDFDPTGDFPSDDIGHGFDNIGDVLTLPPVLLERYLAAAEAVMNRAIVPDPPKPVVRWQGAQYTEPASANVPLKGRWRMILGKPDGDPVQSGPVNTQYKVPADGEYVFRTRVYAETAGKGPVRIAILAKGGKDMAGAASDADVATLAGSAVQGFRPFVILKTVEVKAREEKKAEAVEVKVPAGLGFTRMAVAVLKPTGGEPPATVYLNYLQLEGPLDGRPASHKKLLAADPAKPKAEQTREVVARFASRAYRRPATADEVARLTRMVDQGEATGLNRDAAFQQAFTAVLCSPKFLFRVEPNDNPTADPRPLSEYELASRLSYFLWSSMPDDELFALAAKGQLAVNLPAQARRMLADPKADTLVDKFVLQWLQLERLKTFQPDPKLFPKFDERLRAAMLEETRLFFREIVREDRSVLDVIDGPYTYVNGPLATHYGIKDTAGNTWAADPKKVKPKPGGRPFRWDSGHVRVDLTGTGRGGVLTQASVLAVTSNPTRTSPVKRGKWVLEQLLGTPPPPAPPDVPELKEEGQASTAATLRQRMEEHRKNPACANCHAKMDPLGFGLENFDAVGAYRWKDGEAPIDASGVLPDGKTFNGPDELKAILRAKTDLFVRCLVEKMLTYALGRGLEYYDKRAVDKIVADLAKSDYKFSALVTGVVTSDPFRLRRGKDQP